MLKGKVQMGTDAMTHSRWFHDNLDGCSPDDRIWGWSVRSTEVLHSDKAKIDDEVLERMLYLGLLDPKVHAPAWTEGLSIRQGVRLVSNAIVRVVQRVIKVDDRVCLVIPICPGLA
jgi:hypothetical protein